MAKNSKTSKAVQEAQAPEANLSDDLTIVSIDDEAGEVLVDRSGRECGPKARFAPGMDARTKGTLQTAFRLGYDIRHADGVTKSAQEWAKDYGYERFLTAKPKKIRKGTLPFSEVKVGRHWYKVESTRIDGKDTVVDYKNAKGEAKQAVLDLDVIDARTR